MAAVDAAASGATAAEPGHPCAGIVGDAGRLACYDAAFGRPTAGSRDAATTPEASVTTGAAPAGTSNEPTVATGAGSAATTAALAEQARKDFGLSDSAKRARDPEEARVTQPESVTAAVVQIGRRPYGDLVVTLDNGQVWQQAEVTDTSVRLKTGDTVTIRKAALGSFVLLAPSRMTLRVRRVR
jgi:hypothetical protein